MKKGEFTIIDAVHAYNDESFTIYKKLAEKYSELIRTLFIDVNPVPVKEAMNMMGLNVGPCRLPLIEMDDATKAKLRAVLLKHNLIEA